MSRRNAADFDTDTDSGTTEDTQKDKYLTFRIAGEEFGIEIRFVTEIIGIQSITPVPEMPVYVKGVINLRGKVIPVIDVRRRFNIEHRDYNERTCIVVVTVGNTPVGLAVDSVEEVAFIPENQVEPPPLMTQKDNRTFVQGIGKTGSTVKILLNLEKMLHEDFCISGGNTIALSTQPKPGPSCRQGKP